MERPASSSLSFAARPPSASSGTHGIGSSAGAAATGGAASHYHHTRSMSRTAANAIASLANQGGGSSGNSSGGNNANSSAATSGAGNSNHACSVISTNTPQALFLQTLRHLNLDQLYDSPALTLHSLTADARTRIRTAEWALYQLFRLYDPAVAAEKLQPFFPPLEPLQSVNLRAALYRCLHELKKDGVLGARDTVLRKSLLDECAGERFWELCVVFASLVLRKVAGENATQATSPRTVSLAVQRGTTATVSRADRESMLPLAIAHKQALMKILAEKERRRARYHRLADVLASTEEGLGSRKMLVEQRERSGHVRNGVATAAQQIGLAEEVLQTQWTGSDELRDALLDGDEDAAKDSIFTRPFETVWQANERDQLFSPARADASVIEDLEFRTRHQRQRLRRWQTFHEKLAALRPLTGTSANAPTKETAVRFDRHHDLRVDEDVDTSNSAPPDRQERNSAASKYDEILTAMREEMRKNHVMRKNSEPQQTSPQARRKSSYRAYTPSPDVPSPSGQHELSSRSPSQTTVPIIRPGMARRVSSRSRSYQQPKVISQHRPIPLKSEIFSPLRSRQSSTSLLPGTNFVASPAVEDSEAASITDTKPWPRDRHHSDGHGHADSGVGLHMNDSTAAGSDAGSSHVPPSESRSASPKTVRWSTSSSSQADSGVDLPSRPSVRSTHSNSITHEPRAARPSSSLVERTRMSMAQSSASPDAASPASVPSADFPEDESSPGSSSSSSTAAAATTTTIASAASSSLAERTRMSMSLAPQSTPRAAVEGAKAHRKSQSVRAAFPVNPFETPPRRTAVEQQQEQPPPPPADTSADKADLDADRDAAEEHTLTPREDLFDAAAAYASVFKSRPRIALSPVLSPTAPALPGGEADDVDGSALSDGPDPWLAAAANSSPLRR